MICSRCHHFVAEPGGTLCARCAGTPEPPAPPLAGTPTAWLRSPVGLGRAAAAVLGLVIATDLFAIHADLLQLDVSGDLLDGAYGTSVARRADHADALYRASGVAQSIAFVTCVVVYLCWFHRVRVNAEVFHPGGHGKKRGWAIGAWFTPVVNLWMPRRITLDIWDASSPWGTPRSHAPVNAWWTLWIISLLADRASYSAYHRADGARELHDAARLMLFSDAVDIAAAALAVAVVLRLTGMQRRKALGGPAPVAETMPL
ncbi:DUF4328 domain-containing protein [Streptomyces sp. NPDC001480]|uniref:DUF4328 domain-containing protein n=1 Tax=Streptomyces sp. NPDC001480 TaxID=3364577 RepID=UPI00369E5586